MNVTYSEKAKLKNEEFPLLQNASARLEDVLGKYAAHASAEWDRKEEPGGRRLYTLRLTDKPFSSTAEFEPSVLGSKNDLQFRLLKLWGNVLQARLDNYVKDLTDDGD